MTLNDMARVNIDAATITHAYRLNKTQEKIIALQNGCICCTPRGDLLDEILDLWKLQKFDYIVVESSGINEPEEVAASFDSRKIKQLAGTCEGITETTLETLQDIQRAGGFDQIARLDTTVTVIDASNITREFHTDELVSQRQDNVEPSDERTVSDLMIEQIEFADVILLNKIDTSKGYQVQSLVYTKYRRFRPKRLFKLLYDNFILRMEYPDNEQEQQKEAENDGMDVEDNEQQSDEDLVMDEPDWTEDFKTPPHEAILENKRKHPILGSLYRSKGEFLLATRPNQAGEWSSAGSMLTLAGRRLWFCTLDPDQYLTGDPQVDRLVKWRIVKGRQ
ncbi:uncharacterized protein J7T54_005172 [Emericellopsis cladophorae]|uniref:CobW C-terminal domain-containing protein n=1 Tax=Emericellopsis cladophorae TaxID=2686198 RepID=A0A9P9Y1V4_9HYPO|nr:uncharacterized protein J7T54_005172 [Emericellopsis cladophorae]KAI6781961.1 hypothetical protein J7T54_005172 [Emericellopsis cladophorae]